MIEGKTPIAYLLEKYKRKDKKSVCTLLYRIEKLYIARAEVSKIFMLIFRIFHEAEQVKESRGAEIQK